MSHLCLGVVPSHLGITGGASCLKFGARGTKSGTLALNRVPQIGTLGERRQRNEKQKEKERRLFHERKSERVTRFPPRLRTEQGGNENEIKQRAGQ